MRTANYCERLSPINWTTTPEKLINGGPEAHTRSMIMTFGLITSERFSTPLICAVRGLEATSRNRHDPASSSKLEERTIDESILRRQLRGSCLLCEKGWKLNPTTQSCNEQLKQAWSQYHKTRKKREQARIAQHFRSSNHDIDILYPTRVRTRPDPPCSILLLPRLALHIAVGSLSVHSSSSPTKAR